MRNLKKVKPKTTEQSELAKSVSKLDLETALIRQEHRFIPILVNAWMTRYYTKDDPRRRAAIEALLWHLFPSTVPALATTGVGATAIIGLVLAYQANSLVSEQNKTIEKQSELWSAQNKNLEKQNELIEAQHKANFAQNEAARRSALATEITAVCDRIEAHIESLAKSGVPPQRIELPDHLEARIAALTVALRPYEAAEQFSSSADGNTIYGPLSPERGYLLQLLAKFRIDLNQFYRHGPDFTYAELDHTSLQGIQMSRAQLRQASIQGANLIDVDLSDSNLEFVRMGSSHLNNANLSQCKLTGAEFLFVEAPKATFAQSELMHVKFTRANLSDAVFDNSSLTYVDFSFADLSRASFKGADLRGVKFNHANMDGADLTGAVLGVNPPTHNAAGPDLVKAFPGARENVIEFLAADFSGVQNLTAAQILKASNWEKAKFDSDLKTDITRVRK